MKTLQNIMVIILIISVSIGLTSCAQFKNKLIQITSNAINQADDTIRSITNLGPSDTQMAKSTSDQIIKNLNNKDSAALKSMFSVNAKKNAKDLDAGIDYIMKLYEGKSISIEDDLGSTDEEIDYGTINMRSINWVYTIKTEKNTYVLQFVDKYSQTTKDNNGLFQIHVAEKNDDERRSVFWIRYNDTPGVLWDGILTPQDYIAGTARALGNFTCNDFQLLFTKSAYNDCKDLTAEINNVMNIYQKASQPASYDNLTAKVISKKTTGTSTLVKCTCEVKIEINNDPANPEYRTYLYYLVYVTDTTEKSNDGLYAVHIVEKKDENSQYDINDTPGAFLKS